MKTYLKMTLLSLFLAACGNQADVKEESPKAPAVTMTVSCEHSLQACGKMVMELAAAGFPVGTTMTTTIDGTGSTSFHMNYGSSPTNQTYSLENGTYTVSNTRVYPPPTTFSSRSLVQVQTGPVAFAITAPNKTQVPINVAILDQDGDGIHDYIDPFPADPCKPNSASAACTQNGTAGASISGNDADGDGCANGIDPQPYNPAVGCTGTTGTTPPPTTTTTAVWYPNSWYLWVRSISNLQATKYTDPLYGTMITATVRSGLTASDDEKFYATGGAVTAGTSRTVSGEVLCDQSGVINTLVMNANTWAAVSGYYTTTVTANTLVKFSYPYTALSSAASKIVQHELGQMPSGTHCRMRNLVDK